MGDDSLGEDGGRTFLQFMHLLLGPQVSPFFLHPHCLVMQKFFLQAHPFISLPALFLIVIIFSSES